MDEETFKGFDIDYISIMYDAVCNEGIKIDSDASKAFYQGALYGAKRLNDAIEKAMEAQIAPAIIQGMLYGVNKEGKRDIYNPSNE